MTSLSCPITTKTIQEFLRFHSLLHRSNFYRKCPYIQVKLFFSTIIIIIIIIIIIRVTTKYLRTLKICSFPQINRLVFTPVGTYILWAEKLGSKIHLSRLFFSNLHKTGMIFVNKFVSNISITNTDLYTE
jgi:hypothetical protein